MRFYSPYDIKNTLKSEFRHETVEIFHYVSSIVMAVQAFSKECLAKK